LGMLGKPKKWLAVLRLEQAPLARNHLSKVGHAAVCMAGFPPEGQTIGTFSTGAAPLTRESILPRLMPTWSRLKSLLFSSEWFSEKEGRGIRCWDAFAFTVSKAFASPWKVDIYPHGPYRIERVKEPCLFLE
jgi:hypothetical protein